MIFGNKVLKMLYLIDVWFDLIQYIYQTIWYQEEEYIKGWLELWSWQPHRSKLTDKLKHQNGFRKLKPVHINIWHGLNFNLDCHKNQSLLTNINIALLTFINEHTCTTRLIKLSTFKMGEFWKQQGKSDGFDGCNRLSNLTKIGFKSSIFFPCNIEIW